MPETTRPMPGSAEEPSQRMSRRRFLALAGGAGVAAALGAAVGPRIWEAATAGAAASHNPDATLVLVTLFGGNDGLNTVIPYKDPLYASARGSMAIDASKVLALSDGFGLHPSLPGMKKLWDAGKLAIVHGVGFADPNYSHFESMDIWQSAVTDGSTSTGWVGRWLDATRSSPLTALGVGPTLPKALAGERVQGVAVPAGRLNLPGPQAEQAAFATMSAASPGEAALLAEVAASGADLLDAKRRIGPLLDAPTASAGGTTSKPGAGALSTQLSLVANLILGGAPSQVYGVQLGNFDTHSGQEATQARLLAEVDTAIAGFANAVSSSPRGRQSVLVAFTEFGRRVASNSSAGTDHGWANVVFVAGQNVRGGFYGSPPSLSRLSEGNLVYTTDFRSVYATMMDRVLGVDPTPFLGGRFPTLSLV